MCKSPANSLPHCDGKGRLYLNADVRTLFVLWTSQSLWLSLFTILVVAQDYLLSNLQNRLSKLVLLATSVPYYRISSAGGDFEIAQQMQECGSASRLALFSGPSLFFGT